MDKKEQILHYHRIDGLSLREISRRVGLNRKTFYRVAHAQQVQHITGEPVGVANLTVSERYVRLPHPAALLAAETLYLQRQIAWLAAEGEVVQNAPGNAIFDDMETSAMRTDASLGNDCFEVKENRITFVLGTGIGVALNIVCLI